VPAHGLGGGANLVERLLCGSALGFPGFWRRGKSPRTRRYPRSFCLRPRPRLCPSARGGIASVMLTGLSRYARAILWVVLSFASVTWARPNDSVDVVAAKLARGPDYALAADRKAKIRRSAVSPPGALGVTVAPNGVTYWIDMEKEGQRGGMLVSKQLPQGLFLVAEAYDVTFSPDSEHVAVLDHEAQEAMVLSTSSGNLVARYPRAQMVRFRAEGLFQYRSKTALLHAAPVRYPVGPAHPWVIFHGRAKKRQAHLGAHPGRAHQPYSLLNCRMGVPGGTFRFCTRT
jgi:hypothetical protein